MKSALTDPRRLEAVQRTGLLEHSAVPALDELTKLAVKFLKKPIAMISLVEGSRQFFVSQTGLPEPWKTLRSASLAHSFCHYVVENGAPFILTNAHQHTLLANSPAVREMGIAAYVGIPLKTGEGHALGSFCAANHTAHNWSPAEVDFLTQLAESAMSEITALSRKPKA